jgi:hypothetical protein
MIDETHEHTQTPWKANEDYGSSDENWPAIIRGKDREYVGSFFVARKPDVSFIVRACSEYNELVAERDRHRVILLSVLDRLDYLQNLWGKEAITARLAEEIRACVNRNHAGAIEEQSP